MNRRLQGLKVSYNREGRVKSIGNLTGIDLVRAHVGSTDRTKTVKRKDVL